MTSVRGFTLIELVIAMTIVAVALAGTLMAINTVVKKSADPMIMQQAAAIAQSYLDEISSKTFPTAMPCVSPQPPGGRANYTNICDYTYVPASGQVPTDQMGNAVAGLTGYTVQVNIDSSAASLQGLTAGGNQVVRIDVTVSNPNIPTTVFSAYRANY